MKPPAITCVAPIFPTPWFPESGAFLKNIADVMCDEGIDVQVVAPLSVGRRIRECAGRDVRKAALTLNYSVVRPRFIELPLRVLGSNALARRINQRLFRQAVERGLAACPRPVTLVYGHFWIGAYAARKWCKARKVPYVVELQESGIRGFLDPAGAARELRVFLDSEGVLCVSKDNERFLVETGVASTKRVRYLPNGFDERRFTPLNRAECRRRLGLPANAKIAAFAGHFIERKGPLRVLSALEQLGEATGVFLGRGPQCPRGTRVLHAGPVLNSDLPAWLSAADVFVLPSLAEGLANVTVEAMACGLPLVVSDRPFNRDFLTEKEAVFVDPESVQSIADGLASVLGSEHRRTALGASALAQSAAFSLQKRVRGIKSFVFEHSDVSVGNGQAVPQRAR
jgi:glycosyltransferase involved in cell wall biosynthesis